MAIQVTGVQAVVKANGKAKTTTAINIREGLEKAAAMILRESQKLVPVKTGNLKRSGTVVSGGSGMHATATVEYDVSYAIYVHENLQAFHSPPTQARFLADAVPRVRGSITAMLKRQVRVAVKDGR